MSIDYRPDDPEILADPFPLYRRMQDEDPAHWSPEFAALALVVGSLLTVVAPQSKA